MHTDDLILLLLLMNEYYPNVLISHIDPNGIVYCTSFHKVDLFLFRAHKNKLEYLAEIFSQDPQ